MERSAPDFRMTPISTSPYAISENVSGFTLPFPILLCFQHDE